MRHPGTIFHWLVLLLTAIGAFVSCEKDDPEEPAIPFKSVHGFVISDQGEKILATSDGLYFFIEGSGRIEPAGGDVPLPPINDLAFSSTPAAKELWLASGNGAFNYDAHSYLNEANSGLHNDFINHIHFDQENTSYYATPEGLSIQDQQVWSLYTGLNNLYSEFEITDIGSAPNGYTYVTTYGGGIERFRTGVDGISGATVFDTDWTWLQSDNIHTVFIDDTIQAYGTDRGAALHFSEFTKWDWMVYTTSDGLINDTVLSIARDHAGNWWFGTVRGISRMDDSGNWTGYSVGSHQIISNRVKFLEVDPGGSVWMAADEGLSHFINDKWVSYPK